MALSRGRRFCHPRRSGRISQQGCGQCRRTYSRCQICDSLREPRHIFRTVAQTTEQTGSYAAQSMHPVLQIRTQRGDYVGHVRIAPLIPTAVDLWTCQDFHVTMRRKSLPVGTCDQACPLANRGHSADWRRSRPRQVTGARPRMKVAPTWGPAPGRSGRRQ